MLGPKRVTSLNVAERTALGMLRTASSPAFAALGMLLRHEGLAIQASTATYVSPDEASILGCLAWAQRGWNGDSGSTPPLLRDQISTCAAELTATGRDLPYLAIQRLSFGRSSNLESDAVTVVERSAMTRGRRASVIALVRSRGSMTARELTAAGISRQYQSLLCRKGILVRTPSGVRTAR